MAYINNRVAERGPLPPPKNENLRKIYNHPWAQLQRQRAETYLRILELDRHAAAYGLTTREMQERTGLSYSSVFARRRRRDTAPAPDPLLPLDLLTAELDVLGEKNRQLEEKLDELHPDLCKTLVKAVEHPDPEERVYKSAIADDVLDITRVTLDKWIEKGKAILDAEAAKEAAESAK